MSTFWNPALASCFSTENERGIIGPDNLLSGRWSFDILTFTGDTDNSLSVREAQEGYGKEQL